GQAAPVAAVPDATTSASTQPQERRRTRQAILAEAAQKAWLERMYAQTETPAFCSQMGIASATLRELVGEIAGAAHRLNLSARLAEKLTVFAHEERRDELIAKAAVLSERVLNRFVSDLGWRDTPAAERPTVTLPDGGARTVFAERPVAYLAESLPAEPVPFRQSYFDDWIFGFYQIVQDNARSGEGGFVNVAQNARLGRIIDVLDQAL
ncbi:virulence factor SrfC family protein, partial [Salinarimonas sp. NSM]|uniref:virulence factor SrfC family protein n=1 Tax=Salinarimonas sp. NSM TaxID=3458003 RepID=UPI00403601C6